ncbi:TetR/AcrR family transcriptional regulator [Nocardiopsis alba]|uniref:TetR/AcrR family transcriptional regulator n=1 Tax=Nocardiopsis alba TaxID=53437 RepID=UPI003647D64F
MTTTSGRGSARDASPSRNPPGRRSPGPRRRLSRELIVESAIELVETEGLRALTMRDLGKRLGVAPGTLYTYVRDRRSLEALILDTVVSRDGPPHELPGPWWEKLEAWARDDWGTFQESPWVLELRLSVREFGPASITWLDSALRIFEGTDISPQTRLDMIDALDAYVRGAATIATQTSAEEGEEAPAREREQELRAAYEGSTTLRWALGEGAVPFGGASFDFGLRSLIAGFRAIAEEESGDRSRR